MTEQPMVFSNGLTPEQNDALDDATIEVARIITQIEGLGRHRSYSLAVTKLEEAKHWLVRVDTEPFIVMARALGLRFSTAQEMLKCGPWKHRLDHWQRNDALAQFQQIDPRAARGLRRLAGRMAWRES